MKFKMLSIDPKLKPAIVTIIIGVCLFFGGITGLMFGWPMYKVWQQGQVGKAELAKAEQNRKILISQSEAEKDAAKLRAEAIAVVGKAAKDYPEYRQQELMSAIAEAFKEGKINQTIYIPTNGIIPVTEASRPIVKENKK